VTEVRIPLQHPLDSDDPILEVVSWARKTQAGDELRVTERIVRNALDRGVTRVGELVAELESAGSDGCRRIADEARRDAGLPSLSEAESKRALALAQRDDPPLWHQGPPRDFRGRAVQECAHDGCEVLSKDEVTKSIGPVEAKRWWCPEHEAEADPGDLDPWTSPPVTYGSGGGFVNVEQAAAEARYYERLVAESHEKALRRQEQYRAERERREHLEELRDRSAKPLMMGGFLIGPGGKILNEPEQG
jgi:hypothetical protein